jgi:CRP-like cAMP-binding protein
LSASNDSVRMLQEDEKQAISPAAGIPLQAGARTDQSGKAIRNLILLSLPDDEYNLIRPYLELVDLPQYFVLHDPGEKLRYAYFLNEGMTSLVVVTKDGHSVEVGIVGREGIVGLPVLAGMQSACFRAIMQIAGSGVRIPAALLEELLGVMPNMRRGLERYGMMHVFQVGQVAACNRLHELDQRLARWLLMCQDRVDSDSIRLTHEFLAQMLGSGRPSVSLAAGVLENAGLIENLRGRMKILNRKQLENAACECYGVIQNFNGGLGLK